MKLFNHIRKQYLGFALSLLMVILCSAGLPANQGDAKAKYNRMKTVYVMEKLNDADKESSIMPIYSKYLKDQDKLRSKGLDEIALQQEMLDLAKNLKEELKEHIGDDKINLIFKAEKAFKREMLKKRNESNE